MKDKNPNIKERVMKSIKEKKVTMRSRLVFVLEKIGLESALVGTIILGALIISILFYFLKKNGVLKFITLGIPGIKVVLLTLPYDYIALAIACIILAIYFANQIELFCGNCTQTNRFVVYFLIVSVILGVFFGILGVGDFLKGWSKKDIESPEPIGYNLYEEGKYLRAIGIRDLENDNLFHAHMMRCCDEY